jgi:hypothetical protein
VIEKLREGFPIFVSKVLASESEGLENVLPPVSDTEILHLEAQLGVALPISYKRFLKETRGFALFGGKIQFNSWHPFFHEFPKREELTTAQQETIIAKGGIWPPPTDGMLCFADYFRDADGDQVLFDVSKGLINGEFPVMYYSHEDFPPSVEKLAGSFEDWLNYKCVDEIEP